MKIIDKISKLILRKESLIFVSILLFFAVRKPIELLLDITVVNTLLCNIDSIWYNDITFLVVSISAIILTFYRFRRYTPSWNLTIILIALVFIYTIYRTTGIRWEFTSISSWGVIKYSDILILILACQLLLCIKQKKIKKDDKNAFFDDQPIGQNGADELGYNSYAEQLGRMILSSHFNKSFAIGINGKWGLGKTSFIDLIKRNVKGGNILEVDFNPWNNTSPEAIIKDFFETVQETIRPYHSSLSKLLIKYSNKLVTLNRNTIAQSIQTAVAALTSFNSVNKLYEEINTALKKIDKKLVVYIDDLDRLDKNEIIEIIRLIRNTANFYNTYFIVTYDRNYVINALKQHNPYNQEEFLEKIFQIEVTLPYFNKDILRYKLAEKLKEKLPDVIHTTIDDEVIGTPSSVPEFLNDWLDSMRDVTRLTNSLSLNFSKLIGEVDFNNFMRMELLRLKYPSAYELLFRKTSDFLDTSTEKTRGEDFLQLKRIEQKEEDRTTPKDIVSQTYFGQYLSKKQNELSIPENEILRIVDFVDDIFGSSISFLSLKRSPLSIIFPSKFHRYFAYSLIEGNLSEVQFSKARLQTQEEFNRIIADWVSKGLEVELKNKFHQIKAFDNREDFEKVIRAIFFLANQKPKDTEDSSRLLIGYDGHDLIDKMNNNMNKLVIKFYQEPGGEEILKSFIRGLFKSAVSPFSFEAELAKLIEMQASYSFPLSKIEINEISIDYLRRYIASIDKLDPNVWNLYHNSKQTNLVKTGSNTYTRDEEIVPVKVKEILKDFLLNKDLDGFLLAIIEHKPFNIKKYAVSQTILELFGNWLAFKEELRKIDAPGSKYLNEFNTFLDEFGSKNYSHYVDFEFKTIPVDEKFRTK